MYNSKFLNFEKLKLWEFFSTVMLPSLWEASLTKSEGENIPLVAECLAKYFPKIIPLISRMQLRQTWRKQRYVNHVFFKLRFLIAWSSRNFQSKQCQNDQMPDKKKPFLIVYTRWLDTLTMSKNASFVQGRQSKQKPVSHAQFSFRKECVKSQTKWKSLIFQEVIWVVFHFTTVKLTILICFYHRKFIEYFFEWIIWNKMVGYHWHIFDPPILLKMSFEKAKTFFSQKSPFLDIISNFTKLKTFLVFFFAEKLHNWGGKYIFETWYHLMHILQQICFRHRHWNISVFFFEKAQVFARHPEKIIKLWLFSKPGDYYRTLLLFPIFSPQNIPVES